jgi:hypothetical protein
MPGVKAAKPNLWPPMNADKNQNALSAFIGGSICFSAGPPVGRVLVRTEGFFASPVGRHTVFENGSCLSLRLCERGRHAAIAVVRGPVKVPAVVFLGDGILRLIAADVDVGKGMRH